MKGIYRNLNAKRANNGNDIWSITNAHTSAAGHLVADKGVDHGNNLSLTDVVTTNPKSINTGCARINRKGAREVVAIVGGTIGTDKPAGEPIGRLTLDLAAGSFAIITDTGRIPFDGHGVTIWFDSSGAHVYRT